jgi:hypothetical protein
MEMRGIILAMKGTTMNLTTSLTTRTTMAGKRRCDDSEDGYDKERGLTKSTARMTTATSPVTTEKI